MKLTQIATLALAAIFAVAATPNKGAGNWNLTVEETEAGHRIGNPDAKVKLIEFVSYTCPHCAHFAHDGDGALQLAYIGPGKVSVEVRHIVRDPADLTATLLANCGTKDKFAQNHAAFMLRQDDWLPVYRNAPQGQLQAWSAGGAAQRRSIASKLGFYQIMEQRGYRRTEVDTCLADEAEAQRFEALTEKNFDEFMIGGTPSFAIDGVTLAGTHDWSMLQPQLDARF